ncbi:hypothetical protein AV530_003560 [Patagioenas fasciata monilis]|uniref:CSD domain-containing protein n=1 Tax=Patagioenas fasciata monilis TaxID=372326 RepID=A0A1V4K527_PATFA|nr:hypothetical protein AV530_003560 [Patagioenas fasciata monilis]
MITTGGVTLDSPIEVFVHWSKLHMKGFCNLKDGEAVEFTFKESPKGLESTWVTGLMSAYSIGNRKPERKDKCNN